MAMESGNVRSREKARLSGAAAAVLALVLGMTVFGAVPARGAVHGNLLPARTLVQPGSPESHPAMDALPAKGKFLVARNTIADPRFRESVILLIACNTDGATGLIINRPTRSPLADMLKSVPSLEKRDDLLYYGGPVEGRRLFLLIRSDEKPAESDKVFSNVYVSMSRNTLELMISARKTARQLRVYSGYAGWFPWQLDREVARGDWLVVNADADFVFEKKESEVWQELTLRNASIEVRSRSGEE